jgi:hypothetical protein
MDQPPHVFATFCGHYFSFTKIGGLLALKRPTYYHANFKSLHTNSISISLVGFCLHMALGLLHSVLTLKGQIHMFVSLVCLLVFLL